MKPRFLTAVFFLGPVLALQAADVFAYPGARDRFEPQAVFRQNNPGVYSLGAFDASQPFYSLAPDKDDGGKGNRGAGGDWTTQEVAERRTQSPTAALLKSMVVPGWGQIGNREYAKAGLVIAVEGVLFARWLHFRNQTVDARAEFEALDDPTLRRQEFEEFEKLRDRRNLFGWLTGTAIFLSMIDAFVGAHLAGFPEENRAESPGDSSVSLELLRFDRSQYRDGLSWQVGVRYRF